MELVIYRTARGNDELSLSAEVELEYGSPCVTNADQDLDLLYKFQTMPVV